MLSNDSILVAVIGEDKPGVIAAVTTTLTRLGCNVEEMTQSILRQQFASIFLVNKPEGLLNEHLELELNTAFKAKHFSLSIVIRDVATTECPTVGELFVLSVWGPDRNDIIAVFSKICAEHKINIEALRAFRIEEGQSLQVLEVRIPDDVDLRSLKSVMADRARAMGLFINIQHAHIFEAIHRVRAD